MIDLTPLDVRNKRGDFKKAMRGYDPQEVDIFLELAAERLEAMVRENIQIKERAETLSRQVQSQSGRERAVQEALVTAQELRADIRAQAQKEAELILQEANATARQKVSEAETEAKARLRELEARLEQARAALADMERRRGRFLKTYRQLLERELDVVEVEQGRAPLEDRAIDLDLAGTRPGEDGPGQEGGLEALSTLREAAIADDVGPPFDSALAEEAVDRVFRVADFDTTRVDRSAEERPPYDAPVDELAALYSKDEQEGAEDARDVGGRGAGSDDDVEGKDSAEGKARDRRDLFALPEIPPPPGGAGEDPRWG
ncbi:MAG TPA: DivIVA domain-containing protein [Longimicrobiales bacterium]|nr:DivIVA domain-containing protein [Longimicrobiales bacterium]